MSGDRISEIKSKTVKRIYNHCHYARLQIHKSELWINTTGEILTSLFHLYFYTVELQGAEKPIFANIDTM